MRARDIDLGVISTLVAPQTVQLLCAGPSTWLLSSKLQQPARSELYPPCLLDEVDAHRGEETYSSSPTDGARTKT